MIERFLKDIYWSVVHSGAWRLIKNAPIIRWMLSRADSRLTVAPGTLHQVFPDVRIGHVTSPEPVETPEAMDMAFFELAQHLHRPTYQPPELYIASIPGVLYCPVNHVLFNEKRDVFKTQEKRRNRVRWLDKSALTRQDMGFIEGPAMTLRSAEPGYYHTLIDNLPRLEYLSSHYKGNAPVKLIRPSDGPAIMRDIEDYVIPRIADNFDIVDISDTRIHKIERLIHVSHPTRFFSGYMPNSLIRSYRDKLRPTRSSRRENRIYISRERTSCRRVQNEDELVDRLRERGFVKYRLEDLSIEQQIDLFHDAEAVVAPHGAGLTNLLFAPEGTSVLELFPTEHVVPHFYFLCKALHHDYTYWYDDLSPHDQDPWKADFRAQPEEIRLQVDEMLYRRENTYHTVEGSRTRP